MLKEFLFGLPIMKCEIDEKLYNKKKLVNTILKNYETDPNRNAWDLTNKFDNSNLHHSYNNKDGNFEDVDYSELLPIYTDTITKCLSQLYFKKQKFKFNFIVTNYTCIKESHFMKGHIHTDCDFSAVHYIKFDEREHHPTVFENTHDYAFFIDKLCGDFNGQLDDKYSENSWMHAHYKLKTMENDFVLTPSFLKHNVPYHHKCNNHRITIVLNINIEKL